MAQVAYASVDAKKEKVVFWQEWSVNQEIPGEPAILIEAYESEISLIQGADDILISRHELKAFIKELQKLL